MKSASSGPNRNPTVPHKGEEFTGKKEHANKPVDPHGKKSQYNARKTILKLTQSLTAARANSAPGETQKKKSCIKSILTIAPQIAQKKSI